MSKVPNVVLVDPIPAEQALLRFVLSRRGLSSAALSPRSGLALIAAAAPDLVALDVGADQQGLATCAALKERIPGAAVVLIADQPLSCATADAVMVRPLFAEQVNAVLGPLLERKAQEPPRRRILVVDDDPDVLNVVERILGNAGCEVTCVSDSRRVLTMPKIQYDLVLVDVVMPAVDGLAVCQILRERNGEDLRICMMTAAHDPGNVRSAERSGADGYLTKPIRSQELLALVGRARLDVAPQPHEVDAPVQRRMPDRRKRVLVVDDDEDVLAFVRSVFSGAGAQVDAIQDPGRLREQLLAGGSYDLVLLDIFMPSVDGIELLRKFSADVRNVCSRFYVISAEKDEALRSLAVSSGADGFLNKPLESSRLLELLAA